VRVLPKSPARSAAYATLAAALSAGVLAGQERPEVETLSWLAGCWEQARDGVVIEEQWMRPRAGTMLGMSRTTREGAPAAHEWILFREVNGVVQFQAHPSGQASATFTATHVSDTALVVENPDHDFPRRIGYRPLGADSLLAWIDGGAGAEGRRVEFLYRRVACGS
jgi:hypothetical protein